MGISISRALLDAVLADARLSSDVERCGLLLGSDAAVLAYIPAANLHPQPERHFELDPAVQIAAERAARSGALAVLGHYHSHPNGVAQPSATDAWAANADGRLWLIVTANAWGLWRSVHEGEHCGRFDAVDLHVLHEPPSGKQ